MKKPFLSVLSISFLILSSILPISCSGINKPTIANPASVNCINKGGTLSIQKRGDGGEYGICIFEDNRQCEEWAMFRGECPVGGIKVAGYTTPAARICVITGGTYTPHEHSDTYKEEGSCTFKNNICDVWAYYNGKCDKKQ
jgi:putative hemolysin